MFTETKAHSKAIDLELRKLEVQQANQHVSYLTQYLPDNFMSRGGKYSIIKHCRINFYFVFKIF